MVCIVPRKILAVVLGVAAFTLGALGQPLDVYSEDDLIRGFNDPSINILLVQRDLSLHPNFWNDILISRNLTVKGVNTTSPAAPTATASRLKLDFGLIYKKWTVAPGQSLTFEDLELLRFQEIPKTAKSILDASPGAELVWRRVWQHWDLFSDMRNFVRDALQIPRAAAYPGEQQLAVVDKAQCQEQIDWPGQCQSQGIHIQDFATDVPLVKESEAVGVEAEGGYVWACFDCYLTTEEVLPQDCVAEKGPAGCQAFIFQERKFAAARGQSRSPVNIPAVVAGSVVGGVVLIALVIGLLGWRRKWSKEESSIPMQKPWEYAPVAVVEGSQFPQGLIKVLPCAPDPPPALPSELQTGVAIGALVGIGSFGMVHKGLFNGRPVALKLLLHSQADTLVRVLAEVQITAALHHDNVAATYCCLVLDKEELAASGKASVAQIAGTGLYPARSGSYMRGSPVSPTSPTSMYCSESPSFINVNGSLDSEEAVNIGMVSPVGEPIRGRSNLARGSGTGSVKSMQPPARSCGVVAIVMEYLGGGSLMCAQEAGWLSDGSGGVDLRLLWPLLMDVARGMGALHAMGCCHGDLKADNCMLSKPLVGPCSCSCHRGKPPGGKGVGAVVSVLGLGGVLGVEGGVKPVGPGAGIHRSPVSILETIGESSSLSSSPQNVSGGLGAGEQPAEPEPAAAAAGAGAAEGPGRPAAEVTGQHVALEVVDVEPKDAVVKVVDNHNPSMLQEGPDNVVQRVVAVEEAVGPPSKQQQQQQQLHNQEEVCCERCRATAKVTDFGLTRAMSPAATHVSTRSHGTVTHMPPEVLMDGHIRPAADVYSYGIMVFELVTGQRAWDGYTYPQIMRMVGMEGSRPPIPDSMPQLLRDMLQKCWSADPAQRPSFPALLDCMNVAYETGVVYKLQQEMRAEIDSITGFL